MQANRRLKEANIAETRTIITQLNIHWIDVETKLNDPARAKDNAGFGAACFFQ